MQKKSRPVSIRRMILFSLILLNALIVQGAFTGNENWYWALVLTLPMLAIGVANQWRRFLRRGKPHDSKPVTEPFPQKIAKSS